jgi:hypothetical protein
MTMVGCKCPNRWAGSNRFGGEFEIDRDAVSHGLHAAKLPQRGFPTSKTRYSCLIILTFLGSQYPQ